MRFGALTIEVSADVVLGCGMSSISVLGPVEVRRSGQLIQIPAGKTSEVLVRLALEAGSPVRTDRLLDDLWGDDAVHTTRNTVHSKIAKLRRALGDPPLIIGANGSYTLDIDPVDVDALAAPTRATEAAALFNEGDSSGASRLCSTALQMFRGEVLAAAGDGDWVLAHRARLDATRMRLIETGCSARLRLGEASDVVGDLEVAVIAYPYHENLWLLLMTALHESGRSTDALATYQRVRLQLADDLGLDPGPSLRALERRILLDDTNAAPLSSPPRLGGNLPPIARELVGRGTEIATVCELLARNRLVEIVGTGGVGKTAVAIAAGRVFATSLHTASSDVWLARLETTTTADAVVDALIAVLNVTGGEASLYERLRTSGALIILDNCEHIVQAAADLAARLLECSPDVRILCTSQVSLEIDGAAHLELSPLDLDDAVELFTRRAAAQRTSQRLDRHDDAVLELCRSLDGLPLAIELAAARTKTLSIDDITRRLDDRFNVLNDPTSHRPERRRALKATIQWSYELLFPDDQRGLWALATFAGGAPLAGIEAVIASLDVPAATAIDVVSRLASRSLLIVDEDASSLVRYRLLDSVRAFALEAMTTTAHAAHAEWFAQAARTSTAGVRSSRQSEHLAFARTERANIDAALEWSMSHEPLLALDIAIGFGWAWVVLGDSRAAQRILDALESAGTTAAADQRADAFLLAGWIEASTGDLALARNHIGHANDIAESLHDIDLHARSCYYLAYVESHDGDFQRALDLTDRSRSLYAGLDRSWDRAANALFAARAAISAGDEDRSIETTTEAGHWLRTVEDPWLHTRHDAALGELARLQHRFDDAVTHLGRAVATSNRLGFFQTAAYQTFSLGRAQSQAGDHDTGAATLALAIDRAEATGDARMATLARVHLARELRTSGQLQHARTALETAAAWHRTAGGGEQAALGDCLLAAMDAADGLDGAEARLQEILEQSRANGAAHVEVLALDALARIAAAHGHTVPAQAMIRLADQRMHDASAFIAEHDRVDARATRQIDCL
jgi:predicted ATPase/DNA-binding SARP family transcriptional activator